MPNIEELERMFNKRNEAVSVRKMKEEEEITGLREKFAVNMGMEVKNMLGLLNGLNDETIHRLKVEMIKPETVKNIKKMLKTES